MTNLAPESGGLSRPPRDKAEDTGRRFDSERGRGFGSRHQQEEGGGERGGPGRFRRVRRKVCAFCVDKVSRIDYKDVGRLRGYVSDRARILKSRHSGNCAKHQRMVSQAIKRAREIALLPFVSE